MARIYESAVIPAPVDQVWEVVGDYGAIGAWHPAVRRSELKDGPGGAEVGAIRECELETGARLLERQTARFEDEYAYTYIVTDSPLPMKNYKATIRLRPVTDKDETFAEWHCSYDPDPGAEEELWAAISGVYRAGFASLKERFA